MRYSRTCSTLAGSSNGRTADSESAYLGSSPSPAALLDCSHRFVQTVLVSQWYSEVRTVSDPLQIPKLFADSLIKTFDEASVSAARIIWDTALSFLVHHWFGVVGSLAGLFVFFFVLALVGQWGSLYSLTYWTLYAVIVLAVGLIFGPEIFVSDWYHLAYLVAIWPLCYLLTGWIWRRLNFKRH